MITTTQTAHVADAQNFVDVLRVRAARHPDRTALTFLEDGEVPTGHLTYESLDGRARQIAAGIRRTVPAGDRVLLLHPPGLEFVTAFFGCFYAGVVPVPVYPPRNARHFPRIEAILEDADARCVLTQSDSRVPLAAWLDQRGGALPVICTDTLPDEAPDQWEPHARSTPDTLAFLQYTSGSTGTPKGVMVTHGNLMSTQRMIQHAMGYSEGAVGVSWLPVYHDMGLIGNLMHPLFLGGHCVLMSPAAFLQKPRRWLAAITRFGAQGSGGPNFAFRLCTETIGPDQKVGLDLSALDVLFCGSEPIDAAVLEEFADAFGEVGFRRSALYCCYGMAETTLMATGSRPGAGLVFEVVDADALATNVAAPARPGSTTRRVVGCGRPVEGQELVIVDPGGGSRDRSSLESGMHGESGEIREPGFLLDLPDLPVNSLPVNSDDGLKRAAGTGRPPRPPRVLEDGRVGEIWVRGANVASGYWRKPDLTRETFEARLGDARSGDTARFLRTGDLGYLRDGELFVTGRIKDLIIVRGRNHYPHDIESTVHKSHPALRAGGGAALAVPIDGEERLVVVQEIDRHHHGDAEDAAALIRAAVAEEHDIAPYAVVLVRQNGVAKTSSGKIRRSACASAFLDGTLPVVYEWRARPAVLTDESGAVGRRSREDIEDYLVRTLSTGLAIPPDTIDLNAPFSSFGLDSLQTTRLVGEIEAWLGRHLSPTVFWNYPTISDLAAHLAEAAAEPAADEHGAG